MIIDVHNHFIPSYFIEELEKGSPYLQAKLEMKNNLKTIVHDQGFLYPCHRGFYDLDNKIEDMEKRNIDLTVLSVAPPLFYYWGEPKLALYIAQMVNDEAAQIVKSYPKKFKAMATVPLSDVFLATQELERCVKKLGMRSVEIGSNIDGKLLNDPLFEPFFKKAHELDVLIFVHPFQTHNSIKHLENYYLANFIGNPLDTTIAMANLIFSGFFERFPTLKFCFAHGGGFFPYQIGRFEHGYHCRPEANYHGRTPIDVFRKQFYFDSITFNIKSLQFLTDLAGPDKVLLGSDSPFEMGDPDPVGSVASLNLSNDEREKILGVNAKELLNIE